MKPLDRDYRNLLREVLVSQMRLREKGTALGLVWSVLHPLLLTAVLFLFFRSLHGPADATGYALYVLVGVVQYTHLANATTAGMTVLHHFRYFAANAVFPKEILVAGAVLASTPELLLSLLVCHGIGIATGLSTVAALPTLLLSGTLQVVLTLTLSLFLAALFVFLPDFGHIYQVLLRILFFVTPTFYPVTLVPEGPARTLVDWNPLARLINLSRRALLEGSAPRPGSVAVALLLAVAVLVTSQRLFRRAEPGLVESL